MLTISQTVARKNLQTVNIHPVNVRCEDERISIRELRKLVGRQLADCAKFEPVVLLGGYAIAYRSDETYQILPVDIVGYYRDNGTPRQRAMVYLGANFRGIAQKN